MSKDREDFKVDWDPCRGNENDREWDEDRTDWPEVDDDDVFLTQEQIREMIDKIHSRQETLQGRVDASLEEIDRLESEAEELEERLDRTGEEE